MIFSKASRRPTKFSGTCVSPSKKELATAFLGDPIGAQNAFQLTTCIPVRLKVQLYAHPPPPYLGKNILQLAISKELQIADGVFLTDQGHRKMGQRRFYKKGCFPSPATDGGAVCNTPCERGRCPPSCAGRW